MSPKDKECKLIAGLIDALSGVCYVQMSFGCALYLHLVPLVFATASRMVYMYAHPSIYAVCVHQDTLCAYLVSAKPFC